MRRDGSFRGARERCHGRRLWPRGGSQAAEAVNGGDGAAAADGEAATTDGATTAADAVNGTASDDENGGGSGTEAGGKGVSKKRLRKESRLTVAELKQLVRRPEVVEVRGRETQPGDVQKMTREELA